ncbi:VIT domain-containing protein [Nonomuraea sp. SBT364]|uniref:VIT domain-containing protein n=1 Tax=Nonomuraea sp. SBT364 TaxID=1580530 RepID=UPI00066E14FC|nr:VIT domain-containing protein [Nonomuraea sp. SBT364]
MNITSLEPARCAPVPDAGIGALRTERGNLPLESVDVTAEVSGLVAGVEVAQGFRNPFDVTLEATYVFPLPDRAAVTAFRMEAGDRVVEGVLKERGQARADYDRALREGRRAAIAEEDRPDVFTIRVGNILPGERVTVRLELSQPLPYEDGAATFRFPLVVAPRYVPGTPVGGPPAGDGVAPDTGAVPDASRITPPVLLPGFPDPVRLSLAVKVDAGGLELRELASSLHVVEEEDGLVRVRPGERLDRDFILRMTFEASTALQLDGAGTFALTVVPPPLESPRAPRDLVLLLDRSGSMGGWKMVAARRAAARIVDTLTPRDRFAVLAFDSVVEEAFEGLAEGSDRNRYRAVEHLARVDARGGTELLDPLLRAIALLGDDTGGDTGGDGGIGGRERVVVLVTDGQVGNEDKILERAGGALSAMRVHAVGIDRAVNAAFLGRLAGLGAGRCELVESEDRLDAAMEQIHRRIGAPLVTDLSLKDLDVEPGTLTHLGSIFPGVPLRAYGRCRDGSAVTVRGLAAGAPWEERVAATVAGGPALRAVWARAYLRELEDRYAMGEHGLEREIVRVSLEHGVLCRFTAYVAVDSRQVAEGGPEHRAIQPVEPPSGWEMPATGGGGFAWMAAEAPRGMRAMAVPAPGLNPGAGDRPAVMAAARGPLFAGPMRARSVPHGLDTVSAQLTAELDRLKTLTGPDVLYLADLGSRLAALAAYLGGHAELAALARELEAAERPDADPQALLNRAIEVLTALTGPTGPAGPAPEGPRRPFWKRA